VILMTRLPLSCACGANRGTQKFREDQTAWHPFHAFTEGLKGNLDALPLRT
jgi:hypothetical protein